MKLLLFLLTVMGFFDSHMEFVECDNSSNVIKIISEVLHRN